MERHGLSCSIMMKITQEEDTNIFNINELNIETIEKTISMSIDVADTMQLYELKAFYNKLLEVVDVAEIFGAITCKVDEVSKEEVNITFRFDKETDAVLFEQMYDSLYFE